MIAMMILLSLSFLFCGKDEGTNEGDAEKNGRNGS